MTNIRTFSRDIELVHSRREQIARSAAVLFVKKRFDKTSIREIAKACRMSIGNLYHYIGSKDDVLSLVFGYIMLRNVLFTENISRYEKLPPIELLKKAIEIYFHGIDDIQDMVLLAYQESRSLNLKDRKRLFEKEIAVIGVFEGILDRGCKTGDFKIHDTKLVANNIVALGDAWATKRWYFKSSYKIEGYIREQTNIIIEGLCYRNDSAKEYMESEIFSKKTTKKEWVE